MKAIKRCASFSYVFLLLVVAVFGLLGCQGARSPKTPFHLNPNMDWQAKYKAQTLSLVPPSGTVAWGDKRSIAEPQRRENFLQEDTMFYFGKDAKGQWVRRIPLPVTQEFVLHGQERFNIYCAACHDRAGTGKSQVVKRGFVVPPDLADPRLVALSDGEIFNIVSNGIRNMPSYAKQIPVKDRWAIVSYVRAIQMSRHAKLDQLPQNIKDQLGTKS